MKVCRRCGTRHPDVVAQMQCAYTDPEMTPEGREALARRLKARNAPVPELPVRTQARIAKPWRPAQTQPAPAQTPAEVERTGTREPGSKPKNRPTYKKRYEQRTRDTSGGSKRKKNRRRARSAESQPPSNGKGWRPDLGGGSPQSKLPGASGKAAANPELVRRISDGLPAPTRHEPLHPTSKGTAAPRASKDAEVLKRIGNINDHDG